MCLCTFHLQTCKSIFSKQIWSFYRATPQPGADADDHLSKIMQLFCTASHILVCFTSHTKMGLNAALRLIREMTRECT